MAFDREAAEAVLKIDYLPLIRPQINMSTPYKAELERNRENVVGLEAHVPLHVGRAEAVGAGGEHDDLPEPKSQRYAKSKFFTRINRGSIAVTQALIESSKTDKGAYLRAIESETKGITNEFKEDEGRQLVANTDDGVGGAPSLDISVGGSSGSLVGFLDAGTGTTIAVSAPDATTFRKLRKNMIVDVVDTDDDSVQATARTVTAVDRDNGTFTVSGAAVTTTATSIVCRTNVYGKEMRGIGAITRDDTELQGVDPAVEDEWRAAVIDAGGAPFAEMLVQELLDEVDANSGTQPDALLCEYTQERAIYAELKSMKRAVNTLELKGGFTALTFNDRIPILVDRQYRPDAIAAINRKHQALYETSDVSWGDEDGNVLKWVPRKMKWEAFLYHFADLGTDRRNAFGVIENLDTAQAS